MKQTITLLLPLIFLCVQSNAQVNFNLTNLGELDYSQDCNDIWGYVDQNAEEYAIIGTRTGTAIIALDRPNSPEEIFFIPGVSSTWRDIKHYGDHLYVTTDSGKDGLLIIDMSQVSEDSISYHFWRPELELNGNNLDTLNQCHNIYADDNGYAYLAGCNIYSGGVLIFNLIDNPDTPQLVGASDRTYAHDCYVNNDILYTSDIYAGEVSIYDVSDKSNPQILGRQSTTSNFTHNAWSSYDNNYVFTTDERRGGFVDAYDISDPTDIRRLDTWQPRDAFLRGIIPHNTHFFNDFLVTSWYTEGLIVLDASQPDNMVLVGQYDTYDGTQTGFEGAWGAYPFLPSGRVLVSDINSGLFVFEPDYVRAARIEGIVTAATSGDALSDVKVVIHDTIETETTTAGNGFYKSGTAHFGELIVSYSKEGYVTHFDTLTFTEGVNIMNDVQLGLASDFEWKLTVLDSATETPIENVQIKLVNENGVTFEHSTDSSGQLIHPQITEGNYTAYIGKWGFKEIYFTDLSLDTNQSDTFYLASGFRDYFNLDLGWETSFDSATTGFWTRVIPVGTSYEGRVANPDSDSPVDFGPFAYITGNDSQGGSAGFNDIDEGNVILKSPWMDLSGYSDPSISFNYWFFMDGGDTAPDDSLTVHIEGPATNKMIFTFDNSRSEWNKFEFDIADYWDRGLDSIRIVFTAGDKGGGHIVESGIDVFTVDDISPPTISGKVEIPKIMVYPNPTSEYLHISNKQIEAIEDYTFRIINMEGKIMQSGQLKSTNIFVGKLAKGTYILDLISDEKKYIAQFNVH